MWSTEPTWTRRRGGSSRRDDDEGLACGRGYTSLANLVESEGPCVLGRYLAGVVGPWGWPRTSPEHEPIDASLALAKGVGVAETRWYDACHGTSIELRHHHRAVKLSRHSRGERVDDKPTLIFLHIGKTAGSTMRQVLRRQFPSSEIMLVRSPTRDPKRLRREDTLAYFAGLPEAERARPRLILGHTIFGLHEFVPRPSTYITLLRDPLSLVVSQYGYVRRTPGHWLHETALRLSLEEYVQSGLSLEMDNSQTRAISGDVSTEFGRCSREMLEAATRHIDQSFTLVGLTERFDESLVLLGKAFGWSRLAYMRVNVAPSRQRKALPSETTDMIRRQNVLDQELYDRTVEAFQRSAEAYPAFDHDLRRLRRRNLVYRPWGQLRRTMPKRMKSKISGTRQINPEAGG